MAGKEGKQPKETLSDKLQGFNNAVRQPSLNVADITHRLLGIQTMMLSDRQSKTPMDRRYATLAQYAGTACNRAVELGNTEGEEAFSSIRQTFLDAQEAFTEKPGSSQPTNPTSKNMSGKKD